MSDSSGEEDSGDESGAFWGSMPLAPAADAALGPAAAAAGYYDVPPGVRESTPRSIYHVSSGSQPLYGSSSAAAPASWRPRAQTDANGLRN